MTVSVRLDKETEEMLEKASQMLGTTKSEVVKKSVKQYCIPIIKEKKQNLSDIIKDMINGHPGSERRDIALRSEEILRERFRRKY